MSTFASILARSPGQDELIFSLERMERSLRLSISKVYHSKINNDGLEKGSFILIDKYYFMRTLKIIFKFGKFSSRFFCFKIFQMYSL